MKYNEVEYNNYLGNAVSIKNRIFRGHKNIKVGDLTFIPERGHFEIKLPHKFRVVSYYNKKEGRTHIAFFDGGILGFSIFFMNFGCYGKEITVKGNINVEEYVVSNKTTEILTGMYNEEEDKIRASRLSA